MAYETILLEKDADDAFAILTLNRPDKLNAIDKTVIHEIVHAVKACSVDPAINALVIRGAGRSFSAGTICKAETSTSTSSSGATT